jgi:hypothetical protein
MSILFLNNRHFYKCYLYLNNEEKGTHHSQKKPPTTTTTTTLDMAATEPGVNSGVGASDKPSAEAAITIGDKNQCSEPLGEACKPHEMHNLISCLQLAKDTKSVCSVCGLCTRSPYGTTEVDIRSEIYAEITEIVKEKKDAFEKSAVAGDMENCNSLFLYMIPSLDLIVGYAKHAGFFILKTQPSHKFKKDKKNVSRPQSG